MTEQAANYKPVYIYREEFYKAGNISPVSVQTSKKEGGHI